MNIEKDKRVLLRADLNVPLQNKKIVNDYKLKAILPTIDMIKKSGSKVILITHLGKPEKYDPGLTTKNLIEWFKKNGYPITFESDLQKAKEKSFQDFNKILLLENVRFFEGEKNRDSDFAESLAKLGDYFVNDAFGSVHRKNTSIALLPKMFDPDKRFLGPLIKKEIKILSKSLEHPQQPFVLIIGGAKSGSKIPMIEKLLDKVHTVLLCPAISFTFSKYLGKKVGKSLVDQDALELIPKILQKASKLGVKLVFPIDYQVAEGNFDGPTKYIDSENIPDDCVGISIGPKTVALFSKEIFKAKTIFFNGAFGNMKKIKTLEGMKAIFDAMAKSDAYTIIGGGDSVAAAYLFEIQNSIDYLSTGGGAALAYLSNIALPGLMDFCISE